MRVFRERLIISVRDSFPFGFEGGMWDSIVYYLVPDRFLSFYFVTNNLIEMEVACL